MTSSKRGPYNSKNELDEMKAFGKRIRQLRLDRNWTQGDLSQAIGAHQTLVSHWEHGNIHPSKVALNALANIFRVSVHAMETGKGFHVPDPTSKEQTEGPVTPSTKVSLDVLEGADAHFQDLTRPGGFGSMEIRDAVMALLKANQEGRSIWIIVGEGSSSTQKDSFLQRGSKGSKPIRSKDFKAPKGHGKRSGPAT